MPLAAYAVSRYRLEDPRKLAIDWLAAHVRPDDAVLIVHELGFLRQEIDRLPAKPTVQWWDHAARTLAATRPRFVVGGVLLQRDGSRIDIAAHPAVGAGYEGRLLVGWAPTLPDHWWWRGNTFSNGRTEKGICRSGQKHRLPRSSPRQNGLMPGSKGNGVASAWLCGLSLLLLAGGLRWALSPASLNIPATPVDQVSVPVSRQWMFLLQARELIPPGTSYSVTAATPDDEMMLLMLSVGVMTGRRAVPRTYYGAPTGSSPVTAQFVVSYECAGEQPKGTRYPLLNGCLWATGARQD